MPYNSDTNLVRIVRTLHAVSDLLALVTAYGIMYGFRFGRADAPFADSGYAQAYCENAPLYIGAIFCVLIVLYSVLGLYDGYKRLRRTPVMWDAILANTITMGFMGAYMFFTKNRWHMRSFIPSVLMLNIFLTFGFRKLINGIITLLRRRYHVLVSNAVLIGFTGEAEQIKREAELWRLKAMRFVRHLPTPVTPADFQNIEAVAAQGNINKIVVMDKEIDQAKLMEIVKIGITYNLSMKILSSRFLAFYNPFMSRDSIGGFAVVNLNGPGVSHCDSLTRRIFSKLTAGIALVFIAPVWFVIWVVIKCTDNGPVIFRQQRYGVDGTVFNMYKFRTMCLDAEQKLDALRARNESDGALFKMRNDPRVTPFGRFLRKTSLDELPQFYNVWRGNMRIVGPRPLPCKDLEPYKDTWMFMRQLCSPGITCIWQVSGRSNVGFEDMCMLDVWYALNRSWVLDVKILLWTVWCVIFGRGAY